MYVVYALDNVDNSEPPLIFTPDTEAANHQMTLISASSNVCVGGLDSGTTQTVRLCEEGLGIEWIPRDQRTSRGPTSRRHLPQTLQ